MQKYCKNQNNINILLDHESGRGFKVTFTINEEGESNILVITRAPKSHNAEDLKKELNKAIKYLTNNEDELGIIKEISFVFLFPVIEYSKDVLEEVYNTKGELFLCGNDGFIENGEYLKNDLIIFESLINSSHIIFAWGEPTSKDIRKVYESRLHYLLKGFKVVKNNCFDLKKFYYVGTLTNQGYPRNYSSLSKNLQLNEFEI